jgi:hypothetical protein
MGNTVEKQEGTQKKKRAGKVIRLFTVEISASTVDPTLNLNPTNPFTQLSEEERVKDLIETFGILWAESCREACLNDSLNDSCKKLLTNVNQKV